MEEKIDFVIIWVDGNDVEWQKEKNKYSEKLDDDARKIRYREWNNLKYWFRGVEKFAPWVNRIHFITCGHLPKWLNIENKKINIVKHSDYIPSKYLPTFSANPIEDNLHRIEGLEEKFVYFNDDMFLINYTKKEDFFKKGLPCDAAVLNPIIPTGNDIIDYILLNDFSIINRHFNKKEVFSKNWAKWFNLKYGLYLTKTINLMQWRQFPGFRYSHLPTSFLKSTFEEVWKEEYDILDKTSMNKFRNKEDVNQFLFKDWQNVKGQFYPRKCSVGKFFKIGNDNKKMLKVIRNQKYKMICINDSDEIENFEKTKQDIIEAFEKILPEKSTFEL